MNYALSNVCLCGPRDQLIDGAGSESTTNGHFRRGGDIEKNKMLLGGKVLKKKVSKHRRLVVSIPRLSAPYCHLLGKINAIGPFFSMRQLCLQSKWPTIMEITDVT